MTDGASVFKKSKNEKKIVSSYVPLANDVFFHSVQETPPPYAPGYNNDKKTQ